jgi:hypothetical protein
VVNYLNGKRETVDVNLAAAIDDCMKNKREVIEKIKKICLEKLGYP